VAVAANSPAGRRMRQPSWSLWVQVGVTDKRGVAEVRVAKGASKLFVSETRYLTFRLPVDVTADMTGRAELDLEPVSERN
jgi:hypothetical protein